MHAIVVSCGQLSQDRGRSVLIGYCWPLWLLEDLGSGLVGKSHRLPVLRSCRGGSVLISTGSGVYSILIGSGAL